MPDSRSQGMTFFDHFDALRPHLIRSVIAVFILFVAAFAAKSFIVDMILIGPATPGFPTNRFLSRIAEITGTEILRLNSSPAQYVNTHMAGQFNLHIKISLATALVVATPYILWELWRFVKPALYPAEISAGKHFVFYVSLCFFTGLTFGYFILAPISINFFTNYTVSLGIINLIDINSYLSTVLNVSLACAFIFQLPILVWFLSRLGFLKSAWMRKYRRHAMVFLAIFAAVITPPDLLTLVLVLVPLYGLYEYGITIAARTEKRKASAGLSAE